MESSTLDFSEISRSLTSQLTKQDKKNQGIYFTPPSTISKILHVLSSNIDVKNIKTILEPSCGSGEFILMLNKNLSNIKITGIEFNKTIYDSIQHLRNDCIELFNVDYLSFNTENTYDLIIGNPPYFVLKKKEVDPSYLDYFEGRPNIFILFIIKSLLLLSKHGVLCFVLPKSFLNSLYYDKCRRFIVKNYKIIDILFYNDAYIETKQETLVLVIQNVKDTSKNNMFYIEKDKLLTLNSKENISILKGLYKDSVTLKDLDINVKVGNVVWNECKDILTDDNSNTLLVYSSDIKENKLCIQTYKNESKKNYINKKGIKGPILVVNRGYGNAGYKLNYGLIKYDKEYLIENHLICLYYTKKIDDDILVKFYEKIMESFKNKKTKQFIDLYFGNNAISTTELNNILPIYL